MDIPGPRERSPESGHQAAQGKPVNDVDARNGRVREDGRMVHETSLMPARPPAESKGAGDLLKPLATIPGDRAFRPIEAGHCPYAGKSG